MHDGVGPRGAMVWAADEDRGEETYCEETRRKTAAPPGNWGKRGVTGMKASMPDPGPWTWDVGTNVRRAGRPMDCVVEKSPPREVVRSSAGAGVIYPLFWGSAGYHTPRG